MNRFNITLCACAMLTAATVHAEQAWLRFSPARPGAAANPDFSSWHVVEQFNFESPPSRSPDAMIAIAGPASSSTPQLLQDVIDESAFESVEIVFLNGNRQIRVLLENVLLAELNIDWDGEETSPSQDMRLVYSAITYIYGPRPDDDTGIYAEVDIATGGGRTGDYHPRDPDATPAFGATLRREHMQPGQFTLSWESEPGIQYLIEYTDDLMSDDWIVVPGPQVFGDEGRETAVSVTEPRGFYRIRER